MEEKPDLGAELGKKLGRAFKNARPQAERLAADAKPKLERLAADAKPKLEKARDDALQFARDHEEEGKQIAGKLVRARVAGPLGMVVDAIVSQQQQQPAADKPVGQTCEQCQTLNPLSAKFCSQCGNRLESSP